MAHRYHPDKKDGDAEKFKEINQAYQVLSNKEKRGQYDQFGQNFEQAPGGGGFNGFDFSKNGGFEFNFGGNDFSDIFGMFFLVLQAVEVVAPKEELMWV
jgi:molecular chaperone DnaJ